MPRERKSPAGFLLSVVHLKPASKQGGPDHRHNEGKGKQTDGIKQDLVSAIGDGPVCQQASCCCYYYEVLGNKARTQGRPSHSNAGSAL
jgi:hypothetical protein